MNHGERGTGRTTRLLREALKVAIEGPEPRLVFFVVHDSRADDYDFRLIAFEVKDQLKKYSMANRMILFKNGGRLRFVNWDDQFLVHLGRDKFHMSGYRPDTPIIWDHEAKDRWEEREMARNRPHMGRPEKRR